MPTLIKDLEELKKLAEDSSIDIYISLNGGARSSKTITYYPDEKVFDIYHHISDEEEILTEKELKKHTNIVEALEKRALYIY